MRRRFLGRSGAVLVVVVLVGCSVDASGTADDTTLEDAGDTSAPLADSGGEPLDGFAPADLGVDTGVDTTAPPGDAAPDTNPPDTTPPDTTPPPPDTPTCDLTACGTAGATA